MASAPAASIATSPTPRLAVTPSPASRTERPRPSIDVAQLAAVLTARLTVLDVADADMAVVVSYLDPKTGKATPVGTYPLGSMEQVTEPVPAGRYLMDFRMPPDSTSGERCTVRLADGKSVFFVVASADAIAVTAPGAAAQSAAELLVPGSPLCKG